MGKIAQGILGAVIGRVGPVVGYVSHGRAILRSAPATIRNPRTERQQAGWRVFDLLSGLACGMRAAVAVGLRGAGAALGMSARNLFIRLNRSCVGAEGVDYSHVLVAEGALAGVEFGAVHREGLRLTASYVGTRPAVSAADGAISCGHGTLCPCSTDYVYLFAYASEWGEGVLSTPAQRREGVVSLTLPSFWAGSEVQLYGFVWDREAECSPSVWLGLLLVDAGRVGEAPDADGTYAGEGPEETPSEKNAEADFKKVVSLHLAMVGKMMAIVLRNMLL